MDFVYLCMIAGLTTAYAATYGYSDRLYAWNRASRWVQMPWYACRLRPAHSAGGWNGTGRTSRPSVHDS